MLLHLHDGDTVFARPGDAAFGEQLRRKACNKLAPPDDKAAVCEDPEGDARQASSSFALLKLQASTLPAELLGVFTNRSSMCHTFEMTEAARRMILSVSGCDLRGLHIFTANHFK